MPSSCKLLVGLQILTHLISVLKETNARLKDCTHEYEYYIYTTMNRQAQSHYIPQC